jgi:hypothetical protein
MRDFDSIFPGAFVIVCVVILALMVNNQMLH